MLWLWLLAYRYFNPKQVSLPKMPPMCSLSYYPVNGGPLERHGRGASRYHLSDKKPFRAPPPGPVAIHPSMQGSPVRRNTTSRVREALRRAPVPLDLSLGSAAGEFRSSAVGPSAARRRVSHIGSDIAGSQEEFRMLRECAVHGPRFLHTRPLSRH